MARGRVTVYEQRGELQISAEYLEPKGAGALQVAFEQLKAKLGAEGLFEAARKKPIPPLPRRIGVVTSPRGAALYDILNVLRRRHQSVGVLIFPAQVQGEAAPTEVSAGIRYFNREHNVDVIVVARGGGSLEDLAAFNHEGLARTIAASKLPVISAIGHETDFTIADFVADLRAPTPSAAAELVIRSKQEVEEQVGSLRARLARAARYQLLMSRQRLMDMAQHGAFVRMRDFINRHQQRLDELVFRLATAERHRLRFYRQRLDVAAARVRYHDLRRSLAASRQVLHGQLSALVGATRTLFLHRKGALDQMSARLQNLSPLSILERGYALVFDASGKLVKDAAQVQPGDTISARVARGVIDATVKRSKT
jgi:exodeoxyribonuclease VII large subunit